MTESIGIVDDWAETITQGNQHLAADSSAPNLGTLAQPGFQPLKTANEFVQVLKSLSVAGPLDLTGHLVSEDFIGEGGQFTVYRSSVVGRNQTVPWELTTAAVKRCKIVLDTSQVMDLTGDHTRRQVHNMFLEVLVLRDPLLRSHRNIVLLLGWAHDHGYNTLPLLVMELATEGDLTKFFSGPLGENWNVRHHLCLDMAAGLDAIHQSGIIHADFKPENVLIFQNDSKDVPLVARLSDFGYSEPEAKAQNGSMIYITALSKGWQAPEISLTRPPTSITTIDYKKADNYSLGLVVWSVCCFCGQSPPATNGSGALTLALKMLCESTTIPESLRQTFGFALEQLLRYDPAQRPEYSLQFLQDKDDATAKWELFLSAERGFIPAQAVVDRVLHSYGIDWPLKQLAHKLHWLFEGTAIGCSIARTDLRSLDTVTADRAVEEFYRRGGYQQYYYSTETIALWQRWRHGDWQPDTSSLRNSIAQLKIDNEAQVDPTAGNEASATSYIRTCRNSKTQTFLDIHELLYLSCLAGDSSAVYELCKDGADASITGEPGGASCLHWLFGFPENDIDKAAAHLIQNGAKVDAELTTSLSLTKYIFPFSWPPGTALHWAVATSSCRAVRVLINNGADCGRQNGDDPYKYDMNVRYLEQEAEDYSQGSYSIPPGLCLGLTPIDLAACSHDFETLSEILAIKGPNSSYFAADEEGYTAFHRLQYNRIGRTIDQRRFSYYAFNGSPIARRESVSRIVQVLKEMGGDINALTKAAPHNERKNDRPGPLTPLMLAVRAIDLDTVASLLEHGSDANTKNDRGYNALTQLPEGNDPNLCYEDLPAIVELLLKHGSQITAKDPFKGSTPLACAKECGSLEVMRLLLEAGADATEKSRKLGVISWWVGSLTVHAQVLSWARKPRWRQRDARMTEILTQSVFSRDKDEVHRVLNNVDEFGGGLLHYAVASRQPAVVQAVLAAGADVRACRKQIDQPRDFTMNSAAYSIGSGTPLDVCLRAKEHCLASSRAGHEHISPEGMDTPVFPEKEVNTPSRI
ncbi:hypothetical protein B0J14DRAFT_641808 [Halenospora varia]|nr:hypothetical protein B0J14DRAFT_641808 [Halenospora varia]